jgi:hypothetical protein
MTEAKGLEYETRDGKAKVDELGELRYKDEAAINERYKLGELKHDEDKMGRHGELQHEGEYTPKYEIVEELTYKPNCVTKCSNTTPTHPLALHTLHTPSNTLFSIPTPFPCAHDTSCSNQQDHMTMLGQQSHTSAFNDNEHTFVNANNSFIKHHTNYPTYTFLDSCKGTLQFLTHFHSVRRNPTLDYVGLLSDSVGLQPCLPVC